MHRVSTTYRTSSEGNSLFKSTANAAYSKNAEESLSRAENRHAINPAKRLST